MPGDQRIEDGDDPVVTGDRPGGLLAHLGLILSTRSIMARPAGYDTHDHLHKYRDTVSVYS
jgi:hypothetical protein